MKGKHGEHAVLLSVTPDTVSLDGYVFREWCPDCVDTGTRLDQTSSEVVRRFGAMVRIILKIVHESELQKDDLVSDSVLDMAVQVKSACPNDAEEKATAPMFTGSLHPYAQLARADRGRKAPDAVELRPPFHRCPSLFLFLFLFLWTDRSFGNSLLPLLHGHHPRCSFRIFAFHGIVRKPFGKNLTRTSSMLLSRRITV